MKIETKETVQLWFYIVMAVIIIAANIFIWVPITVFAWRWWTT